MHMLLAKLSYLLLQDVTDHPYKIDSLQGKLDFTNLAGNYNGMAVQIFMLRSPYMSCLSTLYPIP
jgi:hypothetical protein